eukprot:3278765-Pyramimonas_sp.AAC.1
MAVLLAKGEQASGALGTGILRAAESTRPITLSNTCNKVVSTAFNVPMGLMREQTCLDVQKGFIKGRGMTNNVLDIEARALH